MSLRAGLALMIEVKVPYYPGDLGKAYNLCMETAKEWVLFLDDDVYLRTQPLWFNICMKAIEKGKNAGLFVCMTNRIGCGVQRCRDAPQCDDLDAHIEYAGKRYEQFGNHLQPIPTVSPSGFFMLTHKSVWESVKFTSGFLGVDNRFAGRVKLAGYAVYLIEGLYLYHGYRREWKVPIK